MADGAESSTEDDQAFILVDDPREFRQLQEIHDAVGHPGSAATRTAVAGLDEGTRWGRAGGAGGWGEAGGQRGRDAVMAILQSRGLALAMVLLSMGVPAAMYRLVGSLAFVTAGRDVTLTAFSDSAMGTFVGSFTQDLLVILCLLGIERYRARRSTGNLILLAVTAVCTLIMINPLNTARYQVGAVLIMVLLFVPLAGAASRWRCPMRRDQIALSLFAIMPLMNLLRYGLAGLQSRRVAIGIDYNSLDYDCFSMFAFAVYRTGIAWISPMAATCAPPRSSSCPAHGGRTSRGHRRSTSAST